VFPEQRRLTLQDYRARIAILQKGENCIARATNAETLQDCRREEREAMVKQRRQHMTDLQALYERNGLPTPQWKRLEKPRGPRPDGGQSEI
jgi:hypothetical protein